jgi:hypothetical protein
MTIRAQFDGKTLVPDEPVNLPVNAPLQIEVIALPAVSASPTPLRSLVDALHDLPPNPDWPADGAAQHDHYLYGTTKRP